MSKQPLRTVPHGVMHVPVTPFKDDMSVDYATFEKLVDWHVRQKPSSLCVILHIAESVSLTIEEHKKLIEISVKVTNGRVPVIANVSNAGTEIAIDLARHAEKVGANSIVVHAPVLHFTTKQDETLYQYYKTISEQVNLGIAMWSHPDSGYLMSPELCARIADLPNIVAIKYSVPRPMYVQLTEMAHRKLIVSTSSEDEWFDNIVELDWRLYLCSSPPYLLQTKHDRRMQIGRAHV